MSSPRSIVISQVPRFEPRIPKSNQACQPQVWTAQLFRVVEYVIIQLTMGIFCQRCIIITRYKWGRYTLNNGSPYKNMQHLENTKYYWAILRIIEKNSDFILFMSRHVVVIWNLRIICCVFDVFWSWKLSKSTETGESWLLEKFMEITLYW